MFTAATMSARPSGSMSLSRRFGRVVGVPATTLKVPSLTAVGGSFTGVMFTVTVAVALPAAVVTGYGNVSVPNAFGVTVYVTVASALTTAVPRRGWAPIVTVPPAELGSFASTFR